MGAKRRFPYLIEDIRWTVFDHIKGNAKFKGIYIDFINGYKDHVHCILSLKADQTLSKSIQLIKGESSFWINQKALTKTKFEWADEYYAVSFSESHLKKVREYIHNQEEHHRSKTWKEECEKFMRKYNFEKSVG
jgi:REP element-mobilizing transposase RayT